MAKRQTMQKVEAPAPRIPVTVSRARAQALEWLRSQLTRWVSEGDRAVAEFYRRAQSEGDLRFADTISWRAEGTVKAEWLAAWSCWILASDEAATLDGLTTIVNHSCDRLAEEILRGDFLPTSTSHASNAVKAWTFAAKCEFTSEMRRQLGFAQDWLHDAVPDGPEAAPQFPDAGPTA